jgi:hypothetical protein
MTMLDQRTRPLLALVAASEGEPEERDGTWEHMDWQRMWLHTRSLCWRTLALVPGDRHTPALDVANLMVRLALDHGERVHVADARALRLKHVDAFLEGARYEVGQGARTIFVTMPPSTSLSAVPIAQAADCSLLCVSLGLSSLREMRATVEEIGRGRFLGSLLVTGDRGKPVRPTAPSWRPSRRKSSR